jgi:hypothetical protein
MALLSAYLQRLLGRITAPTALTVGILREQNGDAEGAKAAYQRAIGSGHEEWAPAARHALGDLPGD